MANASIEYDEKILNKEKLEEFVKQAGFKSLGEFKEINLEAKNKTEKTKFVVFTFLAIFLMYDKLTNDSIFRYAHLYK